MRHFPIYVDLRDRTVVVSGAGDVAVAKLRLLMKTEARIEVYGSGPVPQILGWAREGRIVLVERAIEPSDAAGAELLYGANGEPEEDARAAAIGRAAGALVNIVDNLDDSDFITPAIVDRDPVTVAIGTEGAAPVLARKIKAEVEAMLPATLGLLTAGRAVVPGARRGARLEGAAGVLDPLLLRARAAGARCRGARGAGGAGAPARRGRGVAAPASSIWSGPGPAIRSC